MSCWRPQGARRTPEPRTRDALTQHFACDLQGSGDRRSSAVGGAAHGLARWLVSIKEQQAGVQLHRRPLKAPGPRASRPGCRRQTSLPAPWHTLLMVSG